MACNRSGELYADIHWDTVSCSSHHTVATSLKTNSLLEVCIGRQQLSIHWRVKIRQMSGKDRRTGPPSSRRGTIPREKPSQSSRDRAQKERIYSSMTSRKHPATDSIMRQIGQLVPTLSGKKLSRITTSPPPEAVHRQYHGLASESPLGMSHLLRRLSSIDYEPLSRKGIWDLCAIFDT